jgi:hypothetical protein
VREASWSFLEAEAGPCVALCDKCGAGGGMRAVIGGDGEGSSAPGCGHERRVGWCALSRLEGTVPSARVPLVGVGEPSESESEECGGRREAGGRRQERGSARGRGQEAAARDSRNSLLAKLVTTRQGLDHRGGIVGGGLVVRHGEVRGRMDNNE